MRKKREGYHFEQNNKKTLKTYKKEISQVAKDLGYSFSVIADILNARSENEIDRIMVSARRSRY